MSDRRDERVSRDDDGVVACLSCAGTTHERRVEYALLGKRGLVLVEDVPAWVCEKCGEQQFDDVVSAKITSLMMEGFPPGKAVREIVVPVFSFGTMQPPDEAERVQMSRYDRLRLLEEQAKLNED